MQQERKSNQQNRNTQNNGGPLTSFRDGAMEVAVWQRQHEGKDVFSLSLRRSFRKGEDWQDQTISLFPVDAARSLCLLAEGYRYVVSQERNAA